MSKQELIAAFHAMWDNYPENVRLIDRSFYVLAGNKAYIQSGGKTDIRCIEQGSPEVHKGCRAQEALKKQEACSSKNEFAGVPCETFWVPVEGEPDYYLHFTNGLGGAVKKMMAEKAKQE